MKLSNMHRLYEMELDRVEAEINERPEYPNGAMLEYIDVLDDGSVKAHILYYKNGKNMSTSIAIEDRKIGSRKQGNNP